MIEYDSKNMRWFCPECKRVDPRHPLGLAKNLPNQHNPPERIGYWLDKDDIRACKGVRIPQSFNEETKVWENK